MSDAALDTLAEAPRRFVLSRARGSRRPEGAVSVARPSKWGNPWKAEVVDGVGWCCTDTRTGLVTEATDRRGAHDLAVAHYRTWITPQAATVRAELRGKDLCCWCPKDMPCHGDLLLEIAASWPEGEMTPEQRRLARHALGLPNRFQRSYRNRYLAPATGQAREAWQAMTSAGFAEQGANQGERGLTWFCLTRKGAEAALDEGERLDAEDFPALEGVAA
jgi:hypothetical protein